MIPDKSIDFVFSFDSLVHVSREIVETYLGQLTEKLKDDGAGFIHHSNLGEYAPSIAERLPRRARKLLTKTKILEQDHQRARDMTAELFRSFCAAHGLKCVCQELVNWRGRRLIDCFTTFAGAGFQQTGAGDVLRNANFMREAQLIAIGRKRTAEAKVAKLELRWRCAKTSCSRRCDRRRSALACTYTLTCTLHFQARCKCKRTCRCK